MPVRKILRLVFPMLAVTCLGIGYAKTGLWIAASVMVFSLLAWLSAARWSFGFLPSFALVLSVSLAAAGLLTGATSYGCWLAQPWPWPVGIWSFGMAP